MIQITRGPEPAALATNAVAWTRELLDSIAAGATKSQQWQSARYGTDDVRAALERDTRGKCMYCESRIRPVAYPNVEHIRPKAFFRDLTFVWSNLGAACPVCNTNKRDRYDTAQPPVNPYTEDPAAFFVPVGPVVWPVPGNDRAKLTERQLEINRDELVRRRLEKLTQLRDLVELAAKETNAALKAISLAEARSLASSSGEYSFISQPVLTLLLEKAGLSAT